MSDGKQWGRYSRDGEERITLGEVVSRVCDRLDQEGEEECCEELDRLFLLGAWGHSVGNNYRLLSDLRGLAIAMYREGCKRAGSPEGVEHWRKQLDESEQHLSLVTRDLREATGYATDCTARKLVEVLRERAEKAERHEAGLRRAVLVLALRALWGKIHHSNQQARPVPWRSWCRMHDELWGRVQAMRENMRARGKP